MILRNVMHGNQHSHHRLSKVYSGNPKKNLFVFLKTFTHFHPINTKISAKKNLIQFLKLNIKFSYSA